MNLSLHANGKNNHLADLAEAAAKEISTIEADTSLSKAEKQSRVAAVKDQLARERKNTWKKLF